jgi:hypothetical protein
MHPKYLNLALTLGILSFITRTSGAPVHEEVEAINALTSRIDIEPARHLARDIPTTNHIEYDLKRRPGGTKKGDTVVMTNGSYRGVRGTVTAVVHVVQLTVKLCNGVTITCSSTSCSLVNPGC